MFESSYETNGNEISESVAIHGDAVKDVAFGVEDLDHIVQHAKKKGAVIVKDIWEERDEYGVIRMAVLRTVRKIYYEKCIKSLIELCVFSIAKILIRWSIDRNIKGNFYQVLPARLKIRWFEICKNRLMNMK